MAEEKYNGFNVTNLNTIGNGRAKDLFAHSLGEVFENIQDPNTSETKGREITLKFKFAPRNDREDVSVEISCIAKLQPDMPYQTQVKLVNADGDVKGVSMDFEQQEIPFGTNISEINKAN